MAGGPTNDRDRRRIKLEDGMANIMMAHDCVEAGLVWGVQLGERGLIRELIHARRYLVKAKRHLADLHPNGRKEIDV